MLFLHIYLNKKKTCPEKNLDMDVHSIITITHLFNVGNEIFYWSLQNDSQDTPNLTVIISLHSPLHKKMYYTAI